MKIKNSLGKTNISDLLAQSIEIMDHDSFFRHYKTTNHFQTSNGQTLTQNLKVVFRRLKLEGDTYFERYPSSCEGRCGVTQSSGWIYVGNRTRKYFGLIHHVDEKEGIQLFVCSMPKTPKEVQLGKEMEMILPKTWNEDEDASLS